MMKLLVLAVALATVSAGPIVLPQAPPNYNIKPPGAGPDYSAPAVNPGDVPTYSNPGKVLTPPVVPVAPPVAAPLPVEIPEAPQQPCIIYPNPLNPELPPVATPPITHKPSPVSPAQPVQPVQPSPPVVIPILPPQLPLPPVAPAPMPGQIDPPTLPTPPIVIPVQPPVPVQPSPPVVIPILPPQLPLPPVAPAPMPGQIDPPTLPTPPIVIPVQPPVAAPLPVEAPEPASLLPTLIPNYDEIVNSPCADTIIPILENAVAKAYPVQPPQWTINPVAVAPKPILTPVYT